jgi:hypothetical protein
MRRSSYRHLCFNRTAVKAIVLKPYPPSLGPVLPTLRKSEDDLLLSGQVCLGSGLLADPLLCRSHAAALCVPMPWTSVDLNPQGKTAALVSSAAQQGFAG